MDLENVKPGEWPNVAIAPGTDRHAATGERVKLPSNHGEYEAHRAAKWTKADMSENSAGSVRNDGGMSAMEDAGHGDVDTREKLEADVHRAADELDMLYSGERFLDTHKIIRWLDRQAAITEREYGQRLAHEIADEWMDAKDEEVRELQAVVVELAEERDNLKAELIAERDEREGRCCVHYNADEHYCNIHETRIKALIADRDEWKARADESERQRDELAEHREAQREELARLNEQVHGKRRIPKKVKWPRFADGKLVKIGRDCETVELFKDGYTLFASDCAAEPFSAKYGEPVHDSLRESEWRKR